jgi:hypothetical protein
MLGSKPRLIQDVYRTQWSAQGQMNLETRSTSFGFEKAGGRIFNCGANNIGRAGMNLFGQFKQTRGFAFGANYLEHLFLAPRFNTAIYQQSEIF